MSDELTVFRTSLARYVSKTGRFPLEKPSGRLLRAFRQSIVIDGEVCTSRQFGEPIGLTGQNINDYEIEKKHRGAKKGVRMPAQDFLLALITWDAFVRALWLKTLPQHTRDTHD